MNEPQDWLDDLLRQFAQMVIETQAMDTDPGFRLGAATANVQKARAAINERFESALGEDGGDRRWPNIAEARNHVRGQARARWYEGQK